MTKINKLVYLIITSVTLFIAVFFNPLVGLGLGAMVGLLYHLVDGMEKEAIAARNK